MTMQAIPTYRDDSGNMVQFLKLGAGFPGFTHRAIVNGKSAGLLASNYKPSAKVAEFWVNKVTA